MSNEGKEKKVYKIKGEFEIYVERYWVDTIMLLVTDVIRRLGLWSKVSWVPNIEVDESEVPND